MLLSIAVAAIVLVFIVVVGVVLLILLIIDVLPEHVSFALAYRHAVFVAISLAGVVGVADATAVALLLPGSMETI